MNNSVLGSISTVLVAIAFFGVCWWAFSPSRKKQFEEAANLPFSDDITIKEPENNTEFHRKDDEAGQGKI